MRKLITKLRPEAILLITLFVLNLFLVASSILPSYIEINPFDGAKYIESGRQLVDGGELRELSRSPTLALMYAVIYLFVRQSVDWFVLSAGIGNLLLYSFLWFATYYFGLRFKDDFSPFVLVGIMFISPALLIILGNPSDALYAAMSAIALAKTIDFSRTRRIQDVAWASLFVGLAFVTRLDGIYLFPLFSIVTLFIGFRKVKLVRLLPAIILPGLLFISVFYVASGLTRGNFSTNISGIAYASLQWYGTTDASGTLIGGEEVIETFGTSEETRGSALIAFSRNPSAVLKQILGNLRAIPNQILSDYGGKKFTPFFLLFVLAGVYYLLHKKAYGLLILFSLWPLNVGLYLPYYTRSGYYLHSVFIPFVLCALGLAYTFSKKRNRNERAVIFLILGALLIYSLFDHKPAFLAVSIISISVFSITWLAQSISSVSLKTSSIGIFIALCAGLILRPPFSFPQPWNVGESPQEQAIHFLQARLDRGDVVGSYVPKPVVAARMTEAKLYGIDIGDNPVEDFQAWVSANNVKGLIVGPNFINSYPDIWHAIELSIGTIVELELIVDPGSTQIFIVK